KSVSNSTKVPKPPGISQYVRCKSLMRNKVVNASFCRWDFDNTDSKYPICWNSTMNNTFDIKVIEYDYTQSLAAEQPLTRNCTVKRYCRADGTWEKPEPLALQCKKCDMTPVQ
ncbi:unnamed protein product, partial [Didymodactylos carnosus]